MVSKETAEEGYRRGESERVAVYAEASYQFTMECPFCGAKMVIRETVYSIPKIGRVILTSRKCEKCGFKRAEMIPLQSRRRRRIYYRVDGIEDLYARVIRSNAATIEIPEFGVSITPGVAAQMVVTNVEGVLRMVEDALGSLKALGIDSRGFDSLLRKLINEGGRFTLIIDDPLGISVVEPQRRAEPGKVLIEVVEGELE